MPNITQKITSYVHGISQQPDHLKRSGQVVDLVNAFPDVTLGCQKRPGSELIEQLNTTSGGKWFSIFRDEYEKYIVQYVDSTIRVWSLLDGTPRVVNYSSIPYVPPENGGSGAIKPTPLPPTCDHTKLATALNAWMVKRSEVFDRYAAYVKASELHKLRAANPIKDVVTPPKLGSSKGYQTLKSGYYFLIPYGANKNHDSWWKKSKILSYNLPANAGEPLIERTKYKRTLHPTNDTLTLIKGTWAYPQAYVVTTGLYTQAQIDQAKVDATRLKQEYDILKDEEFVLRKEYEKEAASCYLSSVRSLTPLADTIPYLEGAAPEDIDILTVNDYTFITNKKAQVLMGSETTSKRPYEAFVEVKNLEYNSEYKLTITKPGAEANKRIPYATALSVSPASWDHNDGTCKFTHTETFDHNDGAKVNLRFQIETRGQAVPKNQKDPYSGYNCKYKTYITLLNGGTGWREGDEFRVQMQGKWYTITVKSHSYTNEYNTLIDIPPFLTPKDTATGTLKVDAILSHFKTEIEKTPFWFATIISNGLYVRGPEEFSIHSSGGKTDDSFEAFTNKVNNIAKLPLQCKDGYVVKVLNTGEHDDDYYVKFVGTEPGVDGPGAWEETIGPGVKTNFDYNSMPHVLTRQPDGTFLFSPVDWDDRAVGDDKTNPQPSFVENTINKMMFYRNRLVMLSGENIILSRAGDFFNFWSRTAVTVSDDDPIDLSASGTTPTTLHSGLSLQQGLVLFSDRKQFMFATSQDILSPQTARLEEVSTYEYNPEADLVDMGTTIGFLAKSGEYSRFFEMVGISDFTPEIIEQSKIVPELISAASTEIAQSKENTIVLFGRRGESEVQAYRYFNDGTKRIMSSWFNWNLTGTLVFHAIDSDYYWTVTEYDNKIFLSKVNLVPTAAEYIVNGTKVAYTPRLDSYTVRGSEFITYDPRTDRSTISIEFPYVLNQTYVFGMSSDRNQGRVAKAESITPDGNRYKLVVLGDWAFSDVAIGYLYKMKVTLPRIFMSKDDKESMTTDTRSYLTVHRGKLQFGPIGMFDVKVSAPSKDDANHRFEMSPSDAYIANTHEVLPTAFRTVPFYEKNTNLEVELTSEHPTPCTLLSMEWEGKISTKNYQRV